MQVLEAYDSTPREYLRMDQAILTAAYWSRFSPPPAIRQVAIYTSNIRFMWDHSRLVRVVLTIQRARARAQATTLARLTSPVLTANTAFMRTNYLAVQELEHTLGVSDAWLLPMPPTRLQY